MWLLIVIAGHLFTALSFIVDKSLMGTTVKNSTVYTFLIAVLSSVVVLLFIESPTIPAPNLLPLDLLTGVFLVLGLLFLFYALKKLETSRVIPFIGGLIPVLTFALSFHFLGERLTGSQAVAFLLLVVGGVLITLDPNHPQTRSSMRGWLAALCAALFFASSNVLGKYTYLHQPFLEALIWSRLGMLIVAVVMVLRRRFRRVVLKTVHELSWRQLAVFVGIQAFGAFGNFLLNYATSDLNTSVTLVAALQGVQFVFILLMVGVAMVVRPGLIKEKMSTMIIVEKVFAMILITEGLILLV